MSLDTQPSDLTCRWWRVGSKVGRTIYAVVGPRHDDDLLIGVMDTPELAYEVCMSHNQKSSGVTP